MIFVGVGPLLVVSVLNYKIHRAVRQDEMVLLHNSGFWNNYTPKRCLHISKQMHNKTHNNYTKSLEIFENNITLFCLKKNYEPCVAYYPSG
jgi:hypothetical protein